MSEILDKIQSKLGITKGEFLASVLILGFVVIGFIVSILSIDDNNAKVSYKEIYGKLDSLAEVNKTTFVGTDNSGNKIAELASADTVVMMSNFFGGGSSISDNIESVASNSSRINLNTASKVELMRIPNVGEKTALKILAYRAKKKFERKEDIKNIKGIGEKKYEKMKDMIEVN